MGRCKNLYCRFLWGWSDFSFTYFKCIQRFILIFVLILIFEINDLANDYSNLQTVPQKIGMKHTKVLGLLLTILFFFLEFFKNNFDQKQIIVNFILVVLVSLFLIFVNENRSKYYTSFWVESIPVFWWLMVVFN